MTLPDIQMKRTCDACPTQYEGTVNGKPAYFRARWGWWQFSVAETEEAAVLGMEDAMFSHAERFGDDLLGSICDKRARRIMKEWATEWFGP